MKIYIPQSEIDRINRKLELSESVEIRVFKYPHSEQIKSLDLKSFISKNQIPDNQEIEMLRSVIQDMWWMARRYVNGRKSYAVSMYNNAIKRAQDAGMIFSPDNDGLIEAKDGMFDE